MATLEGTKLIIVAGPSSSGKTTTTAMLAWVLEQTGADPSYLVGGLPRWNQRAFRLGQGGHLVIEGDEYNSAFFDRGPKFLHYRPHLFLIGPLEFDHADLYPDLKAILTAFRAGAAQVPRNGAVVVNTWSEGALAAARAWSVTVTRAPLRRSSSAAARPERPSPMTTVCLAVNSISAVSGYSWRSAPGRWR